MTQDNENQNTEFSSESLSYDFNNKRVKKEDVDFIIYHNRCSDGFTSALAAYMYLRDRADNNKKVLKTKDNQDVWNELPEDEKIIFYGANHWDNHFPDVTGRNVLICDFSFKKNILDQMMEQTGGNLLILDHHKTAVKELEDIPNENKVFDMNHSGAFITWVYFFGFNSIPRMVRYVEDRDIWTKKLPNTDAFSNFLFSQPFTFDAYEQFMNDDYLDNVAFPTGMGMELQNQSYIKDLANKTIPKFIYVEDKVNKTGKYYFVAYLNSNILKSELGNSVLTHLPYANFSAIYSHEHYRGNTSFSLRSLNERTDVSEVAKLFGGGGHRCASGMGVPYLVDSIPARVIDDYRAYFTLDNLYEKTFHWYGKDYNVVLMNTNCFKKHFPIYLMQDRNVVVNGEDQVIQEALSVMRVNLDDPTHNVRYDGAILWNIDGKGNLCTTGRFSDELRNLLFEDFELCSNDGLLEEDMELKYHKDSNLIETSCLTSYDSKYMDLFNFNRKN